MCNNYQLKNSIRRFTYNDSQGANKPKIFRIETKLFEKSSMDLYILYIIGPCLFLTPGPDASQVKLRACVDAV